MLYPVYKQITLLLGWQSLIGTLCVCFFFLLGREEGLSALLAVVAVTIPNVCFGLMLRGERDPTKDVIRAFIRIAFLLVNLGIAFAFFVQDKIYFNVLHAYPSFKNSYILLLSKCVNVLV